VRRRQGAAAGAVVLAALSLAGCAATQEREGAQGSVGYTVTPPRGWEDITRAVERRTGAAFDVAYGGPAANVNITQRDAPEDGDLAALVRASRAEVDELGGGGLSFTPPLPAEIAGTPARRYDFGAGGKRVRQVVAVRDGEVYVVTLTAARTGFRRGVRCLETILRSWRWD